MSRSKVSGRLHIVTLGIALLLTACATTPRTYSNIDRSADFSRYSTFGFFDSLSTDKEQYESMESSFLKVAVSQEMDRRGFRYADDPDLLINFYVNSEEKIRSRSAPTVGAYYGYRGTRYGAWGGYGYETRVDQYTEGTLNVDVVDARTGKLVWEGIIVGRLTEKELHNLEPVIDGAVREVFKLFPVPRRAANPQTDARRNNPHEDQGRVSS